MKRNFLMLLCVIALAATCFASCQKEHTHTFSSDWASDATSHWHAATCEHGEIKDSLAPHADSNEDGACDVCAYDVKHVHTFESAWSYDEANHWKNATCSHADEKGELSLHSDEDIDGACDVCSGHVHNVNGAGYCSFADCGKKVREIDETSLDDLIAAVVTQKWMVNGGTVDYKFDGYSNTGADYTATKNDIVEYIFGKDNYTHTKVNTSSVNAGVTSTGTLETWHQLVSAEETFGVVSEDGSALVLDISNVDRLNGYYIALSTLAGDYGVEETLYALYEAAIGETVDELRIFPDTATNKVTFKYSYKTVFVNENEVAVGDENTPAGSIIYNVNFFEVEVTFKYSDDYALESLEIICDAYTNDPGTNNYGEFLESDVDLDYDPDTDTFTLRENALADVYTIRVTQTIGERTAENPNPQSKFVPESFELYLGIDEEGVLSNKFDGSTIEMNVRDILNLYVGDYSPVGTSLHFVADFVTFKLYRNNEEVANPQDYLNEIAVAEFTFAGEQRSFFVIPKADGVYRFEIYVLGEKTHEVNLHVGVIDEEFIDLKDNEFAAKVNETFAWTNEVTFTATDAGTYYFNLPAGIGFIDADAYDEAEQTPATDDSPEPYFDVQQHGNENGGSFSVTLAAGESIRFYVSGAQRGTYVISYYVF